MTECSGIRKSNAFREAEMKFACSTWMMPGDTFRQKIKKAREYGFEGVEIRLFDHEATDEKIKEITEALDGEGVVPVSLVMPGETYRKPLLTENDLKDKLELGKKAISAAAAFGCPTIVCPEYGPQIPLPLFDHPRRPDKEIHELLIEYLTKVTDVAKEYDVPVMIEPINRYETRFFYTLEDGKNVIDEVGSEYLFLLADIFHMSIEEKSIPEAIVKNGSKILHVHLGDSNRYLPGQGHTDFHSAFEALRAINYSRFAALECSIKGEKDIVLPACVEFLKSC